MSFEDVPAIIRIQKATRKAKQILTTLFSIPYSQNFHQKEILKKKNINFTSFK